MVLGKFLYMTQENLREQTLTAITDRINLYLSTKDSVKLLLVNKHMYDVKDAVENKYFYFSQQLALTFVWVSRPDLILNSVCTSDPLTIDMRSHSRRLELMKEELQQCIKYCDICNDTFTVLKTMPGKYESWPNTFEKTIEKIPDLCKMFEKVEDIMKTIDRTPKHKRADIFNKIQDVLLANLSTDLSLSNNVTTKQLLDFENSYTFKLIRD